MTDKRRIGTEEFKRAAVRLVTDRGYRWWKRPAIWDSMRVCSGAGNVQ